MTSETETQQSVQVQGAMGEPKKQAAILENGDLIGRPRTPGRAELNLTDACVFKLVSRLFQPSVEKLTEGMTSLEEVSTRMRELRTKAIAGDNESLKILFFTAYEGAVALERVMEINPGAIQEIAKKVPVWPVLSCDSTHMHAGNVEMFKLIRLGEEVQVCDARTMFTRSTTFRACAFNLLKVLEIARTSLRGQRHLPRDRKYFQVVTGRDTSVDLKDDLREKIDKLPDFSSAEESFDLWSDAVKALLNEISVNGEFEKIPALRDKVSELAEKQRKNDYPDAPDADTREKNCMRGEILNRIRDGMQIAARSLKQI